MHWFIFVLCLLTICGYPIEESRLTKYIYIIHVPIPNSERTYTKTYSNAIIGSCILAANDPVYNLEYHNRQLKACFGALVNTCRLTHKNDQPVNYMAVQSRLCGMIHVTYLDQDITLPGEPGQFHLWPGIGQGS